MQHALATSPCPASPDDPQTDRPGKTVPARIAALLHTVRIMLGFGRQLAATATQRSGSSDFNAIAACFGTGRLFAIMAHLQRGILRATALENVLLERAARGRDIGMAAPHKQVTAARAAPADPPVEQPAEAQIEQLTEAQVEQSAGAQVKQP